VSPALQQLMERNVLEVFGERDSASRKSVINELYVEDCTFSDFESGARSVGRDALDARVEELLEGAPGFVFRLDGSAQVLQDLGRARWRFGPDGGAAVVAGMDVAIFKDGRIGSLYTFLEPVPSN
jgi:hypothetical protein